MRNKLLIILFAFLFANTAFAKETINVYTKFSNGSPPGRILFDLLNRMNEIDEKYEYKFSTLPGGEGETAIARVFKDPGKVLLYAANAEFTFFREKITEYDKKKDFIFIQSIQSAPYSLIVPKIHNISSLDQLIDKIKNKPNAFYANLSASNATNILTERFIEKYGLGNNLKPINYSNLVDVGRGTIDGEFDFFIFEPSTIPSSSFDVLFVTSKERNPFFPETKSITELGLDNLYFETLTFFATNSKNRELAERVEKLAVRVCENENFKNLLSKNNRVSKCMGSQKTEQFLLKEYNHFRY